MGGLGGGLSRERGEGSAEEGEGSAERKGRAQQREERAQQRGRGGLSREGRAPKESTSREPSPSVNIRKWPMSSI